MGELMASSPLSLFLLPKYRIESSRWEQSFKTHHMSLPSSPSLSLTNYSQKRFSWGVNALVISSPKLHTTISAVPAGKESETLTDNGDDFGGGGGGNKGDDNDNIGKREDYGMNKTPMSMSQKLTLGYAVLVGVGGVIGYLKSGSQKSIISGLLSSSLLYYVYTLLPTKPVIASALGFVLSLALLGVMGSRFNNSGKIFPAGIVSFVSLIMTGGYFHGFMRGAH